MNEQKNTIMEIVAEKNINTTKWYNPLTWTKTKTVKVENPDVDCFEIGYKYPLTLFGETRFWVKRGLDGLIWINHAKWSTTGFGKDLHSAIRNMIEDAIIIKDSYLNEPDEKLTVEAQNLKHWLAGLKITKATSHSHSGSTDYSYVVSQTCDISSNDYEFHFVEADSSDRFENST